MLRLRTPRIYNERKKKSGSRSTFPIIVIACEGKTEEVYFKLFSDKKCKVFAEDIRTKIEVLEKANDKDTKSAPKHVISLLDEYCENYGIVLNENKAPGTQDQLWMVIDRDWQNNSKEQLEEIVDNCLNKDYSIAISNPTFELWILLHFKDLSEFDVETIEKIKKNSKRSKKSRKRFLEEELSRILDGYKKGVIDRALITPENVKSAVQRAKNLEAAFPKLKIENFGTTVYKLVENILH